tara:strand:- start:2675 stop:4180 length:1506 start_codon:yes stop_codon:yes gene_type:complete
MRIISKPKYLYSYIPYADITGTQETNSVVGDKDKMPRAKRGSDILEVKYLVANKSYYTDYSQLESPDRIDNQFNDKYPSISLKSDDITISNDVGLEIAEIEIVDGGSGYTAGTLTTGGGGAGASPSGGFKGSFTVDGSGVIDSVTIHNRGGLDTSSGGLTYTSEPTVVINGGGSGSGAILKPHLVEKPFSNEYPDRRLKPCYTLSLAQDYLPLAGGTLTGNISHAGDFALDVAGSIELNADAMAAGNGIQFKDASNKFADFQIHHSATWLYMYENGGASNDDYFGIECLANGATKIHTLDNSATAAHLTFDIDGDITLDSASGNFIAKKAGTEFSAANSSYAGMILGYTCIRNATGASYHNYITIGNSFATLQTYQGTDVSIVFKAPPSGNVEIAFSACVSASSREVNFALSDNSTYNELNQIHTYDDWNWKSDETDHDTITVRFVVTGLTAGTSYTYYIGAKASSASAYIYHGCDRSGVKHAPPIIVKATALPGIITTGE